MKFLERLTCGALLFTVCLNQPVCAANGDMGFFGGISEGTRLPKTTELLLLEQNTKKKNTTSDNLVYKEMVFLSGRPVLFEGLLTIRRAEIKADEDVGATTETYTIRPSDTSSPDVNIDRTITFTVNYRRENNQLIKDYEVRNWTETITTPDGAFKIDPKQSRYGVSIIQDDTPGVQYYKGNISARAVYVGESGEGSEAVATTMETAGSFYGYNSAWSSTETHRVDVTVFTNDWQMQYQLRPSVSVAKLIQFDKNEPTAISFDGNYKEVMQNTSGLEYNIFTRPKQFYDVPDSGKMNIPTYNSFEQLIAPDLSFLKGHFAESDIKKLFAMQVLSGDPKFYQPNQAITRGQFVTALVKAVKMPVALPDTTKKARKNDVVNIVFPDVTADRLEYPYIMAAYNGGLAVGRENGYFFTDKPIERQEAIVILLRALGLEQLGLDPTPVTLFVDDYKIANWAKREVSAAEKIGIISGDNNGEFKPTDPVSKAEAAAVINRLIDYMRTDLATDYTDHIVNYAN